MSPSRTVTVVVALVATLVVLVVASVAVGSDPLHPARVWAALRGTGGVDDISDVRGIRWPRTVLALVVGAALAVAGTLAQGHTRNPLADPGLLGVGAGGVVRRRVRDLPRRRPHGGGLRLARPARRPGGHRRRGPRSPRGAAAWGTSPWPWPAPP